MVSDLLGPVFDLLVAVTVVVTATAIGLETNAAAIRRTARRQRVFTPLVVVNSVVVPLAAAAIVAAFPMPVGPATGVLICACCAAGPLALKGAQIAKGDLAWAVSLTVILTLANAASLPLWSALLLPKSVAVQPSALLGAMLALVVLPVALGAAGGRVWPDRAGRLGPRLEVFSSVTLALAIAVALLAFWHEVQATAASWALVAIILVLAVGASAALLVPGQPRPVRSVSTLVTMNRATGIALLVVSRAFADQVGVVSTVITYGLLQTAAVLAMAVYWRRSALKRTRAT